MSNHERAYEQIGFAMTCRSYREYADMFRLEGSRLAGKKVLDLAAGASSFSAEAARLGAEAVACDPRYSLTAEVLERDGAEEIETSMRKLAGLADLYRWEYYGDFERYQARRVASLRRFVEDYRSGTGASYVAAALPALPFGDGRFELVLVSHFLFLYGETLGRAFHESALAELVRITAPGGEIRIYPLVTLRFEPYPHMDDLLAGLERRFGVTCRFEASNLPFVPNSERLLVIEKNA